MTETGIDKRPGRAWLWTGIGVLVATATFAGGWAAQSVFAPPENLVSEDAVTTVEVREGTLASYLDTTVTAVSSVSSTAVNRRTGTVTSLDFISGSGVEAGQTVYTVDLLPVSIAEGAVPMYRPISEGAKGEDVAQLQRLLRGLGHFSGSDDGVFGPVTSSAVKQWQKTLGEEQTGTVDLGRLIFVAELPARLNALDDFQVGDVVSGSEPAFDVLNSSATFTANLTENQARQVSTGQPVEITSPIESTWIGSTGTITVDAESGAYRVSVVPVDGAPICGEDCESLPTDTTGASLRGRVVLQPEATGAIVPTAAVLSRGDGRAAVVGVDGERIEITVVASADGQSLVEGVEIGTEIRAPVDEER